MGALPRIARERWFWHVVTVASHSLPLGGARPARETASENAADEQLRALIRRVRQIELKTRKAVNAAGQGAYHSRFKGRGMAFSESRAYVAGDDPRHVDWNATARRQSDDAGGHGSAELFVKQFVEERELTVLLAVDLSGSMSTGSAARSKRQVAAEAAALLAFSALRNNDKVGLVAFTDRIELLVRPKKGRSHVLRLLREILAVQPRGRGTNLAAAIETVTHLSKQRAIVALISDLQSPPREAGAPVLGAAERPLKVLARRHDLIAIEVEDSVDQALPDAGLVSVQDPETGKRALIDTSDPRVRKAYAEGMAAERARVRASLEGLGVDHVTVTDRESSHALVRFLRRRARKAA